MNDGEASNRIDQMVVFIRQEAEEKAEEIRTSADEEFQKVKLQLVATEKQRIQKEYERKEAQVEANKKIDASKQLNEQRLKILQAKQGMIKDVFVAAKTQLKEKAKKKKEYTELVAELMVQAMKKLGEQSVILQCREVDVPILEAALPTAQSKYEEVFKESAPQTTIDKKHFLALPPTKDNDDDPDATFCLGGVVVTSVDGRIVVNNTIDTRLRIIEEEQLPAIREMLFPDAESEA